MVSSMPCSSVYVLQSQGGEESYLVMVGHQ